MVKKSKATNIISICIIAVGVACLLFIVIAPQISAITNPPIRMPPESLSLNVQGVTENNGYCNVSLSIINCGATLVRLDKIQMEGTSVLTYINGAEIINPSQMSYDLNINTTVQVNLIVPMSIYAPNASIIVYTPEAMYYQYASVI